MNQAVDYYKILQVRFGADKAEIVSSYKRLCKLYHPDVSRLTNAREIMIQLNLAYDILRDDDKRREYDEGLVRINTGKQQDARAVMSGYFESLMHGDYAKAYSYLCSIDKRRMDQKSFRDWRSSVQELCSIRDFSIKPGQSVRDFMIDKNIRVPAEGFIIDVLEKDYTTGRLDHTCFTKYVIRERGVPGVYLGYRDLGDVSYSFDRWAKERERDLMKKHWAAHLQTIDRPTGLFSREGLLEKSKSELYRARRYKRPVVVACLQVQAAFAGVSQRQMDELLETVAEVIRGSLRLTDFPAHLGGGMFAVVFTELKKRYAGVITERLLAKAENAAKDVLKSGVRASCVYEIYSDGPLETCLAALTRRLS